MVFVKNYILSLLVVTLSGGKTLNSREEEDELLSIDVGVKSPNHVNLCSLLCGLICLLVDCKLPHT